MMEEANDSSTSVGTGTSEDPQSSTYRSCWVCFGTDDDEHMKWVKPCRCKGTTMWVHHACLMRWIDEKQKGHSFTKVKCPQCNTEYVVVFPPFGKLTSFIQTIDHIVFKASPIAATGVLLGSIYWSAVTYGAITVMQVLGHKEGLDMMERADPLFLLVGLPMIPVGLVLGKMIQWDDYLLRLWKKHSSKLVYLKKLIFGTRPSQEGTSTILPPSPVEMRQTREIKFTRVLCGALIFPTVATIFGKLLFHSVESNFQRSALGGASFVILKGFLNIYLKYQVQSRMGQREIKDYVEPVPQLETAT
ncbi:E3 ubiquitin-protein ligase MARCHF5-like isoform X2 [Styela clava]|uniref:E3 ubiquitin-protein ligase MARCHF5-like n=1 Tax=Styela clava TaxID=7725 RepID=UPI0019393E18|nr:E3 ubiquitin-protein ligase MARCHF5-like [Styela clava]